MVVGSRVMQGARERQQVFENLPLATNLAALQRFVALRQVRWACSRLTGSPSPAAFVLQPPARSALAGGANLPAPVGITPP